MKKTVIMLIISATMTTLAACSSESSDELFNNWNNLTPSGEGGTGGEGNATAGNGELTTFNIAIDKTTPEPTDAATAYYPETTDNIATQNFGTRIDIDMSNPVAKSENGVEISVSGGHVTANHGSTKGVCYVVSGTTDNGSLTIEGKSDFELSLNGTSITNPQSTAIDIEGKGAAYIVVGGSNSLTDGTAADDSHKAALYAKGKMLISGTGELSVYGVYNNGIHSKGYIVIDKGVNLYVNSTANHGIKAASAIINGGIVNVETSSAGGKGINCDEDITINGGRTTVVCTGNGRWDTDDMETKAAACIACDSVMTINGGEVYAKATGSGGKGLKADWEAYINGGKLRIVTTGGLYYNDGTTENHNYTGDTDKLDDAYTSSPKGIKVGTKDVHGAIAITDGDIMVRTTGNNGEGIESKGTFEISGGTVMVSAHDDAINSSGDLTISDGTVVAVGTSNDGIDSNGNMYLNGGTIIAMGAGGAEAGIDINEQKRLYITGGYIFGIGGRCDGSLGSTTQGIATTSGSVSAGSTVSITSGTTTIASFTMPPYSYTNGTILVSAPGMKSGTNYTLTLGSASQSITASNTISSGGFPGGGGMPGGGGGRPGNW
ncbi:MAG: carbohydrate-binding domain-containing protein [Bacteroidaceae bacterium]|nr:carbohydrate-binding domain-containing protein [Bacteroidaceae bacterium]